MNNEDVKRIKKVLKKYENKVLKKIIEKIETKEIIQQQEEN